MSHLTALIALFLIANCRANIRSEYDNELRESIPHWIEPLSQKMSDYINYMNTTWRAGENFEYGKIPLSHVKVSWVSRFGF